ncbi:hypothetical protein TYRP_023417 [Tyrophagus putrescentiae]|nr:hypothetical protein TYRP_023417 [Tyrophagus putrescentiae]
MEDKESVTEQQSTLAATMIRTSTVIVDYRSKEAAAAAGDIDSGELEYKKQKISQGRRREWQEVTNSSGSRTSLAGGVPPSKPVSSSAGRLLNITTTVL